MGLGPPVCDKCTVIAALDHDRHRWYCPTCKDEEMLHQLWDYSEERQQQFVYNTKVFKDNETLLKFMEGESNGNS